MDKNIICMKWGDKFDAGYVNRLYEMVEKNITIPHRFVCFTDNGEGINPNVEIRPIPPLCEDGIPDSLFQNINHIVITACGTAMHAGLIGKNMMEKDIRRLSRKKQNENLSDRC